MSASKTIAAAIIIASSSAAVAQTKVAVSPGTAVPSGTCAAPAGEITESPSTISGTTVGGVNGVDISCTEYGTVDGPERIYTFTPTGTNNLTFSVIGQSGVYDPAIYILDTCGDGTSCLIGSDDVPSQFSPSINFSGTAGTEYFFYVDSYWAAGDGLEAGPFTLNVTGTFPVTLTEFSID
ncbi:MAG TPA: hypothetical protein VMR06_05695 [Dokdonella sp.]|uniref:hypothetical protein n=1 Tax=Dokdonella sp. TaxID=2291710 RepID=UPI002C570BF2|nr:hypothetical protein [Dokdonella sp.]HUD41477.1 hypothetical protein [Dokdonella sp.]